MTEALLSKQSATKPTGPESNAYESLLASVHRRLKPRAYLQIGFGDGSALSCVSQSTRSVVVHSEAANAGGLPDKCVFVRASSDAFFANPEFANLTGLPAFDLVLLDGVHLFEFLLRDFANAEQKCAASSVILIPGCVPPDEESASRRNQGGGTCGDVWKIIPILQKYRPELKIQLFDVGPAGLAAVSNLDPANEILRNNMSQILREFLPQGFEDCQRLALLPSSAEFEFKLGFGETARRTCSQWAGNLSSRPAAQTAFNLPNQSNSNCTLRPCVQRADSKLIRLNPVPTKLQRGNGSPRMLGVLLCYNDADVLSDSIESLLENNHDLIVWDHGSTDETPAILDRYADSFVERIFVPRDFDFYKLYPTVSKYLIDNYIKKYDWISWPDQDELLEGPDRSMGYPEYVQKIIEEGYSHVQFDNYNYWFTNKDDANISSPVKRIRHYSLFANCSPRIRAWRADVTNERLFNHNPLEGKLYPQNFRLRHYPARDYERALKRIILDRGDIERSGQNFHYNIMGQRLSQIVIDPARLHVDDGISDLHPEVTFYWPDIYFPKPATT